MTRAAVNAAATADALLAWLETQTRVGATAAPAKSEGCPEEAASAQIPTSRMCARLMCRQRRQPLVKTPA